MPVSLFIFLLILLFSTPLLLSSTPIPTHNRRALHQPFFPLSATAPAAQPPSPSLPKYPSSDNPQSFFPFYTTPPSPPSTAISSSVPHTFPANIPSVISRPTSRHSSAKLVPAVLLPLIALALLVLTIAFFFNGRRRQRHSADKPSRSDGQRLFPPDSVTSDGRKRSGGSGPATGSEFLYLGTLVGSRRRAEEEPDEPPAAVPYCKLASPELRPLPPLSRQFGHNYGNAEGGCSSDEEFFSPRGSSAEKESPGGLVGGPASSSRRAFLAAAGEKCRSQSPTLSSPSYPSSNSASSPAPSSPVMSSSPVVSSPEQPTIKLPNSRSNNAGIGGTGFRSTPPLRPLPPLPLLQPLTPPPPKRKPTLPSPPSSSQEKDSDRNSRILDFSGQHLRSRFGDFSENPFAGRRLQRPPPPPPPPPPAGYWEGGAQKPQASQPQTILGTPGPIGLKNSSAAVSPAELPENLGAVEKSEETPRPKLKPLHWDKVRASSDRAMVWDQLKSSSFKVNEEMIETLFVCNTTHATAKETTKWQVLPSPNQENMVLDPKKSQNIAILLRALNVTKEEVCEALSEANTDALGTELLETLLKMAPTKVEELKLKVHKDDSPFKLGPAETFLKAVLNIPFAFRRVDAMLYIANFDSEVNYLIKSFGTLEAACEELRSSRLFLKLLEAVLKTGNRMNVGTNRGGAHAFKLDTLLKLVDVKGTDGKTTLLHFVVQEIIRAEGSRLSASDPSSANAQASTPRDELELKKLGLKAVAGLGGELSNVKKAAAMDSGELSSYVSRFGGGIGKITEVLRLNDTERSKESGQRFHEAMSRFRKKAEDEIIRVQAQESVALSLVKEITEYFHGNSAKEEAHPFRIFMVVRDFLSILDQVCKEVGRIDGRSSVSSARQFPMPANLALLPLFPRFHALRPRSSDDEISSSSS